ncbi:MAG: hypothetical protein DSY76_06215 [Bacteroidetes bacterium]|nr:MAG: hypothetical protein DSY76_06215 [Bacteroidota bacterium]
MEQITKSKNLFLVIFFTIGVLFSNRISAQEYIGSKQLRDSSEQELYLRIENANFIRDRELYSKFTDGFVNLGFFVRPTLEYYFTNNTRISAGVHLLKFSGRDEFTQAIPILSIQQRFLKHFDLVLGSIYSSNSHNLDEPIYKMDNFYLHNIEYGMQLLSQLDFFKADFWINWEQHIFKDDPFQEKFQMGFSSTLKLGQKKNFGIEIPLQLFTLHKGGQIDASPDPAISIFNGVTGLNFIFRINKNHRIRLEPTVYSYKALRMPKTGLYENAWRNGEAYYLKVKYENPYFRFMAGYWHGHKFIAPKGDFLFQSVSETDSSFTQEYRKLFNFKFIFNYPISKDINIQLRTDEYYDITSHKMNHSYSLFFIINHAFFISKIKTREEALRKRNLR